MTTQPQRPIISLSAELARPDDRRRQSAQRWQSALHRLCLLRATTNETTYEIEWVRIFDHQRLMDDLRQRLRLLELAALDVLEVQHEHGLMVLDDEGIDYDGDVEQEKRELLAAIRIKVESGDPPGACRPG
jgi:hypothetical protein